MKESVRWWENVLQLNLVKEIQRAGKSLVMNDVPTLQTTTHILSRSSQRHLGFFSLLCGKVCLSGKRQIFWHFPIMRNNFVSKNLSHECWIRNILLKCQLDQSLLSHCNCERAEHVGKWRFTTGSWDVSSVACWVGEKRFDIDNWKWGVKTSKFKCENDSRKMKMPANSAPIYSIPAWGFPHTTIVSCHAKSKGKRVFAKGKKFLSFLFAFLESFWRGWLGAIENSTLREDCWRKFSISLTQFSPLLQFPWRKKAGTRRWKSKVFLKLKSSQDGYQEKVGNLVIFEMRA